MGAQIFWNFSETSFDLHGITSRFFFRAPAASLPSLLSQAPPPLPGWSHTGCCVYPHRIDWRVPCNESAERRDSLAVGFHLSSRSQEKGAADVMILAPDVKQYMLPRFGATAASGWLSGWLCFRMSAWGGWGWGGGSGFCVCMRRQHLWLYIWCVFTHCWGFLDGEWNTDDTYS